ncbi:putative oxidoreductase [Clostridium saccharoperbutylacetonicum]|uniref:Aldo/keto reductase n=2 Tax=Clostridium TaxID=1485 RepID=M1LUH7_9CLOT|nr:aldo/keto reductase [Clostridium saccharoperbutylacetonicum]AGF56720.1 aldo/keto reductase [Clostridium saccharoperbutylacetonicum N1-4(HMT)]NRT62525.1 putative oxidoreductase [Clostridium saccharoperbutylacetonicum]NSB25872.1 putative oxidoreductase [Clostridium saccharoperbutylacetonicum]NSB45231.1 putative oxidoreductase [Clostridium saccharoperbutylacetonicum]
MKQLDIGKSGLKTSELILGCMRIANLSADEVKQLVETAIECGIDLFDHADIYGGGRSEELFGEIMTSSLRDKIKIQTKCSIRKGYYDYSAEHILTSVDGSLKRLNTDYVDTLLLHRPDTLMEPEEVAYAFDKLHSSGKVKNFGVSNHNSMQIELLQKYTNHKIIVNQMQLSITNTGMIDSGLNVNTQDERAIDRDGSILEYCRLKDITIQAWSPFQYGFFQGTFLNNDKFPELNKVLDRIAKEKGVSNSALAIAWILRHPAKIQPIIGSTNKSRLKDICTATNVTLSREEWYEIYLSAGNKLP